MGVLERGLRFFFFVKCAIAFMFICIFLFNALDASVRH